LTDTFLTVAAGEEVAAEHHNDLAEAFAGVVGAGRLIRHNQVSDATSFAAEWVNKSTSATAPIARWGHGTTPTWDMTLTPDSLQLASGIDLQAAVLDVGGTVFNVKAYGAVGDGVADDYLAINLALAAAKVAGGVVYFPPGTYKVTQPINGTWVGSPQTFYTIRGSGAMNTIISFQPTASATYTTTPRPVLDLSSTYGITVEDITITSPAFGGSGVTPAAACGIMLQSGSGLGSNSTFRRVFVSGYYTVSALWIYAYGDCSFYSCAFQNNATSAYAVVLTGTNGLAKGVTMQSAYDQAHITTGIQNVGDMTFMACEIHNESTVAQNAAVFLDGVGSLRFYGGVIASKGGATCSHFETSHNASYTCNNITIIGTQLYPEAGTAVNQRIFDFTTAYEMDGLTLINVNCSATEIVGSSTGALFRLRNVFFWGAPSISGSATHFVNHGATSAYSLIRDSILNLNGLAMRVPGDFPNTLTVINPGAMTSNTGVYSHFNSRVGTGANDAAAGNHTHTGFVAVSETGLKEIRGRVFTDNGGAARIDSGTGFTAARNGTGDVTITFTAAFSSAPSVTANVEAAAGTYNQGVTIVAPGTTTVRLVAWNAGAAVAAEINFVALGPS
jgi:hypothetical protein